MTPFEPERARATVRDYFGSRWFQTGVAVLVVGAAPLLFIVLAAALGLWPDPNPNPVGAGLLFFFTFWPGVLCIAVGAMRAHAQRRHGTGPARSTPGPRAAAGRTPQRP